MWTEEKLNDLLTQPSPALVEDLKKIKGNIVPISSGGCTEEDAPGPFTEHGVTRTKEFSGGLLGHWSVWTKKAVDLFGELKRAKQSGRISAELLTAAAQLTDINGVFFDTANGFKGCIAGLHEVLRRQGLMKGIWCLNPEETLSPGQSEEIDRVYSMYPQWCDDEFVKEHLEEWKSGL